MYTIDLDLHLTFSPPMNDNCRGVVLTRSFRLPFPAYEGLVISDRTTEEGDVPLGLMLKGVIWDMGRGAFLANSGYGYDDMFSEIVPTIQRWRERGWEFGSWRDRYPRLPEDQGAGVGCGPSDAVLARMPTRPPRYRTREFNALVRALVRHMAESFDQLDVAYAMDQTGVYFDARDDEHSKDISLPERRFIKVKERFFKMSAQRREAWAESTARYTSLQDLALGRGPARTRTQKW